MEATIAAAAIEILAGTIFKKIANEASLLFDFKKDFEWMRRELTVMKDYLKDAHQKSAYDAVKRWLGDLQDVVFDAEDIVDECATESESYPFKYEIGKKIRDLKERMKSIDKDARRLQLLQLCPPSEQASTSSSGAEQWKRSSFLEINAQPVAIEDKVDEIICLFKDAARSVIAVVGMGGVGKTFLLQNVYNDSRTKEMFEKCIWLSVSQTYSLKKLQADLASSLGLKDVVAGHLSKQRAAEEINGGLNGEKFLIMLDDVWRATEQDNLIERLGLPIANTQCKIVVTTRSMEVCTRMNASSVYRMEILNEKDSWDLLCVYARPLQHLEDLARKVERECGKLPLALKVVGASMASRTRAEQWESMLHKLRVVTKHPDHIMEILQLSYDFLPAHLKPCFLYFAFFGEDEVIKVEYLIELWIAEGFIPEGDDARETGLEYYYQLSNLCLVEAVENEHLRKSCKIHDLLLDLAIDICKKNKCGFTGRTDYSSCRRIFLAKQGKQDDDISKLVFPTFLRTLSLRRNDKIREIPSRLFSKVRALRVLDLSHTSISELPSGIQDLKLLRLLNLSGTRMNSFPSWIKRLKNLRVLYMVDMILGTIREVPDWVCELECLEVLHIWAKSMPKSISKLLYLRSLVLYFVNLAVEGELSAKGKGKWSVKGDNLLRLEDVGSLTGLRELRIEIHSEAELQRMEHGVLDSLVNMRTLTIYNAVPTPNNSDGPLFPEKLKSMEHLDYLSLRSFVVPSSDWICQFKNLTVLQLRRCHCSEYPAVESLPNLTSLLMVENNKCIELRKSFGKSGAFPKLRFLSIHDFSVLEGLPVLEGGSMPCLEKFSVTRCLRVRRVEGLELLKNLKVFGFSKSGTEECRERLQGQDEVWKKIKNNNPQFQMYI